MQILGSVKSRYPMQISEMGKIKLRYANLDNGEIVV